MQVIEILCEQAEKEAQESYENYMKSLGYDDSFNEPQPNLPWE